MLLAPRVRGLFFCFLNTHLEQYLAGRYCSCIPGSALAKEIAPYSGVLTTHICTALYNYKVLNIHFYSAMPQQLRGRYLPLRDEETKAQTPPGMGRASHVPHSSHCKGSHPLPSVPTLAIHPSCPYAPHLPSTQRPWCLGSRHPAPVPPNPPQQQLPNSSSRLYISRSCLKFHLSKVNFPGPGFLPTSLN